MAATGHATVLPDAQTCPPTDPAERPQDDFHRHANGPWADAYVLPEHRAEATLLSLLAEQVQDDVAAVIHRAAEQPDDDASRQIAALYTSFMDEDEVERRAAAPLADDLAAIGRARDHTALARVMGHLQAQGCGGAVELSVTTDTADAARYVLHLTQAGLGLPDPALYRRPRAAALRERYLAHLQSMFGLAGLADPAAAAAAVLRVESALAAGHSAPDAAGRLSAPARSCTAADLAATDRGFPWQAWLQGLGEVPGQAAVLARSAAFLDALDTWWSANSLPDLKHWLTWLYLHEMAPFGPRAVFAENFAFYGRALTGSTSSRPRWMRAVSFVQTILGDAVGERYREQHTPGATLDQAHQVIDALVAAYRTRLAAATWMRPATRAAALDKLDRMAFEVGSPKDPVRATDLRLDPCDLIGNVKNGRAWHISRQLRRLCGPVDRCDWKVPAQAATAYYRHGLNQVVVPAALLQPPVFDPGGPGRDADAARNFALLGSIVCHEMSHAFDSRGAHYDGRGRVRGWWDPQDLAEFTRRTALLVDQYDRYAPEGPDGPKVSGQRTVGENIADITGLAVAHTAFERHLAAAGTGPDEHARQTRRFFLLWASMWRTKTTADRARERLATDRHAPARFRCNGALGHIPAFYQAFGVAPGDGMYLEPHARFTLV